MEGTVDRYSIGGRVIDTDTVIDNDNCISEFSRFLTIREEVESFMTKLKGFAVAVFSADGGVSVAYKIKDLEG